MSTLPKAKKLTLENLINSRASKNNVNLESYDIPKNQKVFGHNKRIKP